MRSKTKQKRAYTLIELIAATVLVAVVFAAGIAAMLPLMRFFSSEQIKLRAADDLNVALEWIKKDAMRADNADTDTESQVTLTITNYAASPVTSETIRYSVQNETELLREHTVGATTTTKTITNLIDKDSPPAYFKPSDNYLTVDMHTKDTAIDIPAEGRCGITLRCRSL